MTKEKLDQAIDLQIKIKDFQIDFVIQKVLYLLAPKYEALFLL